MTNQLKYFFSLGLVGPKSNLADIHYQNTVFFMNHIYQIVTGK